MMRIDKPLSEKIFKAYCELHAAMKDGINKENLFKLNECFSDLSERVLKNEAEQEELQFYRTLAHDAHHKGGHLEVDDEATVSLSDDGAYVECWVWIDQPDEDGNSDEVVEPVTNSR